MGDAILYLIIVLGAGALGWKYQRFSIATVIIVGVVAALCSISFGKTGVGWRPYLGLGLGAFMLVAFGVGALARRAG